MSRTSRLDPGSERTPSRDRACGEDAPRHFRTMGELAVAWRGGRRRWALVVAAVGVVALAAYGVVHALTAGASEKPAAPALATVGRGAVSTQVATTGTVQPAQIRSLSFAVAGTVESVAVTAGSTVTPGQGLARVDDTDAAAAVDSEQNALATAEDALDQARANVDKGTTSACTGVDVPAAYPSPSATPSASASPRPTPTRSASPTASHPSPTRSSSPTRTGSAPGGTRSAPAGGGAAGGTPSNPCGTASSRGGQSGGQSGPTSGQSGGQTSGSGGSGQNSASGDPIYSAQERVNQARVTLENAEQALDGATITASIAGRILAVSGKVGSQVSAGATFVTLADVYDMQISADFPESDADHLAVEQKAVVTLADRPGAGFRATVVQVDPTGTSDGTLVRYGVLLSFDDGPKDLLVGQSAAVRVTTGAASNVLRVPSTAVHGVAGATGTVRLVTGAGTTAVQAGVGLRGDQYTQITSGLAEGDRVVRSW
jgi:HlyD family secretion protein